MKSRKFIPLVTLLIVIVTTTVFGGCSPAVSKTAVSETGSVAGTAIAKQIIISRSADSDNLDYVMQDGNVNIWMFNLVLDGLVKSSDDKKTIEPNLADTWDISADKLTYTFHLKKDVKFSDGTPVKGSDWVFSLKRARDTKGTAWAFSLEAIKDIVAPDDNTVVISLKTVWAPIMADLAMFNASVTSEAYFNKVGAQAYSQLPIGTGPYVFKEWKKGEYITLEKNTNYWIKGLPKTQEIKVTVVPDDNTRILQLQSGEVDATTFVPWNRMAELNSDPKLAAVAIPSTETRYIQFNTTKKVLSDKRVRVALDYATDKQALMKTILFGYGEAAKSFMAKSGAFWDDNIVPNPYDVNKAKELLAEAGYKDGFDVTITVPTGNVVNSSIATVLKEQWKKVGVNLNIEMLETGTATDKFKKMKTDITLRAWTDDMVDASEQVDYTCVYANIKNFYTGWDNPEVEKLASAGKSEADNIKRKAIYYKIQELYAQDIPMMPLFHVQYPVAMKKTLKGFVQTPLGNYRFENLEMPAK